MKISRKSWAYTVWMWNNKWSRGPTDLCSFVRQLIWSFVKYAGIVSFSAAAASVVLLVAITPFLYSWFGQWELEVVAIGIFGLYCLVSCLYFAVLGLEAIRDARINRRTVYREPGLVRSWYRAKKQKICPFITVTE